MFNLIESFLNFAKFNQIKIKVPAR